MSKFFSVGTEAAATCNAARLSLQALIEQSAWREVGVLKKINYILLKRLNVYRGPLLLRQVFVMSCEEPAQRDDRDGLSEIRATNIPGLPH